MRAKVLDYSPTGIGISTTERLHPGMVIAFEPTAGIDLPAHGRVIWVMHQADGRYRAGIQFLEDKG